MKNPSITWAGGELSPGLFGRTDLDKYKTGLELAENFLISVEGGVIRRPGTYYVGKTKFGVSSEVVLREWRLADDDAYVMEIGHLYIRLLRFGGLVPFPGGHVNAPGATSVGVGGFLEIPTPYTAAQVRDIKLTFANDVVYLFHKDVPPQVLKRLGQYDFSMGNFVLGVNAPTVAAPTLTYFEADDDGTYSHFPEAIDYRVSVVYTNGEESNASPAATVAADLGFHGDYVDVNWTAPAAAPGYTVSFYKIFKRQFGIFGYVGRSDTTNWRDKNIAPAYDQVPKGTFDGFGDGYPRTGEFYKQRLGFGSSRDRTQTLWFSQPTLFGDLTQSIPLQDDDGIEVELVGGTRHTINHMVELKKFVVFTDTAEWIIDTVGDGALSNASINPTIETYYGSRADLRPIKVGERILFVETLTNAVRDMGYNFQADGYLADDLSRLSRHLFQNKNIISWSYARFPYNLVYAITSDGQLNHLTYDRDNEIWGWSHSKTQGRFKEVACVPEINQNASYFLVDRDIGGTTQRFIERAEVLFDPLVQDEFYVDCGLTYSSALPATVDMLFDNTVASSLVIGHTYLVGDEVEIQLGRQTYRAVVTAVAINSFSSVPRYGTEFAPVPSTRSGLVRRGAKVITGLGHLEGCAVEVLADGNEVQELVVTGGQITLPDTSFRVHVGLGAAARLRTLDLEGRPEYAGQYEIKSIAEINIRLGNSRNVLVGPKDKDLFEIKPRVDEDYDKPNRYLNGIYPLQSLGGFGLTAGVEVLCSGPFPSRILNISPDVVYGRIS